MSDPIGLIPYLALGLAAGCLMVLAMNLIVDRLFERRRRSQSRSSFAQMMETPDLNFCRDCGKALISYRSQDGFSPLDGSAAFSYTRACPDGSQNLATVKYRTWPFCGVRAGHAPMANAHVHADPTQTSPECPVCIDQMVNDGIIDHEQAAPLYKKARATVPSQHPNDMWAAYPTFLQGGSSKP